MIRVIRYLRPEGGIVNPEDFYFLPEGERGCLFLERGAMTRAFLQGRMEVSFSDIAVLAFPILNHRLGFRHISNDKGKVEKAKEIISEAVEKVVKDGARGI